MNVASLIIPLAIIGVIAAIIVILAVLLLPNRQSERSKALSELVKDYSLRADEPPPPDSGLLKKMRIGGEDRTAKFLQRRGWHEKLQQSLSSAGMRMKPEEFVLLTILAGIGGMIVFFFISATIPGVVLGLFFGAVIPIIVLRFKISRREAQFLNELPDTLTNLASGMSAGSSLSQALEGVARESTGPMGDELQRAIIQMRLGTSVPDALEESAARMHCDDLLLVVMAMRLQSAHGGNLAELLKTVSATLRERVQMKRHVRALSAEGRLSMWVLLILPVFVLIYMAMVRREYFNYFLTTTIGIIMLAGCGLMMFVGYIWARAVVKVEV